MEIYVDDEAKLTLHGLVQVWHNIFLLKKYPSSEYDNSGLDHPEAIFNQL